MKGDEGNGREKKGTERKVWTAGERGDEDGDFWI